MAMTAQLPSWNDGAAKQAIIDFVGRVIEGGGPDYVEPAARIAVFDNDGTLWTEKPLVIQLDFTIRRFGEMAKNDPALRTQQPYQAAYEQDLHWMRAAMVKHYSGDDSDLKLLMVAVPKALESVTIEDYDHQVRAFFDEAANPHLKRPYRTCSYAPMVELLRYLEANGFVTYIASGRIGRRPILAFGNSNGDVPMLAYAGSDSLPALRLLLLHDDAEREFDYVAGAEEALDVAAQQNWTVVSIKNDWNTVFADAT
jgi:phosphoglycolate phosphatase-like HAD superfamily hydrolase